MPSTAPHLQSPSIYNYRVGRGYATLELAGESGFQDMGNCTEFKFKPNPTNLQHFSSRQGVQTQDYSAITRLEGTLDFILDEITPRNLQLIMLGDYRESGGISGIVSIDAFYDAEVYRRHSVHRHLDIRRADQRALPARAISAEPGSRIDCVGIG